MLNYVITIAISVIFVPHYLSIFWEPLRTNPWDIIIGVAFTWILVGLNIIGVQEAARLNIFLAVVDFATQLLLVALGFVLIFRPHVLWANVHFGDAPSWGAFLLAIPVGMIAYTGIETVSNLAEEARDPVRTIPRSISWVAIAVFAIYFTLPWIALSAMPVVHEGGHYVTQLGQDPPHGFKNDPVLGLVENLGLHGAVLSAAKVYVGILAATILFIATNAGVIGASRITYSMSSYRQLPEVFRRLHPKLKTPWLSLIVFAGVGPTIFLLSGQVDFLGRMYAFGAMLSFTIAHAAVIALRVRRGDDELEWRARPNLRIARDRLAGVRDRRRPRHGRRLARRRHPGRADALRGPRLARRPASSSTCSTGGASACRSRETSRAPVPLGAGARARVPLDPRPGHRRGGVARGGRARSAARDRTRRAHRPAAGDRRPARAAARRRPDGAARGRRHGSSTSCARPPSRTASGPSSASYARATRAARSSMRRSAAGRRSSCSEPRAGVTATIFGHTVDYVLKNAPSRVMVAAGTTRGVMYRDVSR